MSSNLKPSTFGLKASRDLFNELEYRDEQERVKNAEKMRQFELMLQEKHGQLRRLPRTRRSSAALSTTGLPELTEKDKSDIAAWKGPRLERPYTKEKIQEIIKFCMADKKNSIFRIDMLNILLAFFKIYDKAKNITHYIPTEKVTVVGDLHGQLPDLVEIFEIAGFPGEDNPYIFNGDFVDRGEYSCEVYGILCALKLMAPDHIHLNRGNHESRSLTQQYGFEQEVREKYDSDMYEMFIQTFIVLPVCAVIDSKVIVVHGGLSREDGINFQHIEQINRRTEEPSQDDELFQDLMWSDPRGRRGRLDSHRGAGVLYGPDVTESFLETNKLDLLIRSHQCVDLGFLFMHNDKCLTVFSASRYGGSYDNKGAVVVLRKATGYKPECLQFEAQTGGANWDEQMLQSNMAQIKELITEHREALRSLFSAREPSNSVATVITIQDWAEVLSMVIVADVPWLQLQSMLCQVRPDGTVNYETFLSEYEIISEDMGDWMSAIVQSIQLRIFTNRKSLEEAFKEYDTDGSGELSFAEFNAALSDFDLGLTTDQVRLLMNWLDVDGNGQISFDEFISKFRVEFSKVAAKNSNLSEEQEDRCRAIMRGLGEYILSQGMTITKAFSVFDTDGNGTVDMSELKQALQNASLVFTDEEFSWLVSYLDDDGSGDIDVEEFAKAFKVVDKDTDGGVESDSWQKSVASHIANSIYDNRAAFKRAMQFFDVDSVGIIPAEEFFAGLEATNDLIGSPLSNLELDTLMRHVVRDDGMVNYIEFCEKWHRKR